MSYENLAGQRFGKLTVLERAENYRHETIYPGGRKKQSSFRVWRCRCDCGNEKDILEINILAGRTRSCGCMAGRNKWREELERESKKNDKIEATEGHSATVPVDRAGI